MKRTNRLGMAIFAMNSTGLWNVSCPRRDPRWPISCAATANPAISSNIAESLTTSGFEAEPAANVIERRWNEIVASGMIERLPEGGRRVSYDAPACSVSLCEGAGLLMIGSIGRIRVALPIDALP